MNDELITLQTKSISPSERRFSRFLLFLEDIIKVPLFSCQQCGECILSSTGFTCCQRCPKRLRNGPCGGTGENGSCEVYPDKKCIWFLIYKRSKRLGRLAMLYDIKKIHNWNLEKSSAWLNVFTKRIEPPVILISQKQKRKRISANDI
jgi:methylenetetrahydrofolate reductase (NADPH)